MQQNFFSSGGTGRLVRGPKTNRESLEEMKIGICTLCGLSNLELFYKDVFNLQSWHLKLSAAVAKKRGSPIKWQNYYAWWLFMCGAFFTFFGGVKTLENQVYCNLSLNINCRFPCCNLRYLHRKKDFLLF